MPDSIENALLRLSDGAAARISLPGDEGYVAATSLWAKQKDIVPRAVVHCESAGDVQAAIRTAREHGLPLSVRGGGHDWAGRALCNGIVIDLSHMREVVLGSDHRSVTIAGGARPSTSPRSRIPSVWLWWRGPSPASVWRGSRSAAATAH
jgi:FAD/FMN-containing dehydrogenase